MRIQYIDACRGFAILLVVIGHTVQYLYCPRNYDTNIIFRMIYAFHMPLFFFLSGYVSKVEIPSFEELAYISTKRAFQLLFPFCIWGIVINRINYNEPVYHFLLKPDHSLWFIFHLFVINMYCNIILYFASFLRDYGRLWLIRIVMLFVGYILFAKIGEHNVNDYGQQSTMIYFYPYYVTGIILGKWRMKIVDNRKVRTLALLSIIVFLTLAYVWYREPMAIDKDAPHLIMVLNQSLTYKYLTASIGIAAVVTFFSQIKTNYYLERLGRDSLGIYVIHMVMLALLSSYYYSALHTFCDLFVGFCINAIILLIVTILLMKFIRSSRYTSMILIGDVDKKMMNVLFKR